MPPEKLLGECTVERTRRSGPGGQNRNKVETAIVLKHKPTGITAQASERRSQIQNQDEALFRLRVTLAVEIRTPHAPDATPSELWQRRASGGRISCNPEHDDFPSLLAEALDTLAAHHDDAPAAAATLGVSPSQLIKFLKHEPQAMTDLNARRATAGMHPLR